jgi:glucose-1-phosphate thymidylyltransferase
VTGCYLYDNLVFQVVKGLEPSARGELESTDLNNAYLQRGRLQHDIVEGYWGDCGESFESLLRANTLVAENGANKPAAARQVSSA